MRTLIFGAILTVTTAGFHNLISSSLAVAREAKAVAFSERFAPVLKLPIGKPADTLTTGGNERQVFVR